MSKRRRRNHAAAFKAKVPFAAHLPRPVPPADLTVMQRTDELHLELLPLRHDNRLGLKRQNTASVSSGASTLNPFASGPPRRLCASTGWVTGSKQKKSASDAGE